MLYWFFKVMVVGPVVRLLWRPWVTGLENIPESGPAILASNHLSVSDSVFLPLACPRRITFIAKIEYFTGRGLKGWLIRSFLTGVGQVPVDRSSGRAAQPALEAQKRVLGAGEVVGIYPEGTRSPDGRLYRGKTGVARVALEMGVPVIPVAMVNTDTIQPIGRSVPKFRPRPGVRIGRPLDFSRYEGMAGDRFVERSMTDEIMYELMQLSGQEYVDTYAAKVKAELDRADNRSLAARTAAQDEARHGTADADRLPSEKAS